MVIRLTAFTNNLVLVKSDCKAYGYYTSSTAHQFFAVSLTLSQVEN